MTTSPALARTALQRLLQRTPQDANDRANAAEVLAAIDGQAAYEATLGDRSLMCPTCGHLRDEPPCPDCAGKNWNVRVVGVSAV